MNDNVIFMCGALRSGSSLTHLILDHHPDISNPGEFDFLFDYASDDGSFPLVTDYQEKLSVHRIFQSKNLTIDTALSYPQLIDSFIHQLEKPNCLLALNLHRNFQRIPYLCPNAKFIHLIRDPRDVARSSIGMGWAGNVYSGVDHWIETEKSWLKLQEHISPDQYIEIRFEQLILSPESELEKICNFLGVTYSDSMLDYADSSTYSAPDPSLVYQWKKKLSARETQYVESKAHALMSRLGYELSGHPLVTLGGFEKISLNILNKLYKLKFKLKRHGFMLVVADRLSRLLRMKALNNITRLRMNEIDKQYLK